MFVGQWIFFVLLAAVGSLVYFVVATFVVLACLKLKKRSLPDWNTILNFDAEESDSVYFWLAFVLTIFYEECFFRLPLFIPIWFNCSTFTVLAFAVSLSALFGYFHTRSGMIFTNGGIGFIFCLVFLHCGGWQGEIIVPFLSALAVHMLYNLTIYFLAPFILRLAA